MSKLGPDPRESYRQEYLKKKREEVKEARQEESRVKIRVYRISRWTAFALLLFSLLLIVDFYLPSKTFVEVPVWGWQRRDKSRNGEGRIMSIMQTENFILVVPNRIHIDYDYHDEARKPLHIVATPILGTVKQFGIEEGTRFVTYPARKTVYAFDIPLPYFLFFISLLVVMRRQYSELNYALCFLPIVVFVMTLLAMTAVNSKIRGGGSVLWAPYIIS